ncbi:MAG: glycosyltransferase [Actinomycetaceae bacterium]|nr:glycosyltransferase [Actinomycetaceae bacterium]
MTAAPSVLTVLITKADSSYCERTLRSLFSQTHLPARLVIGVLGTDSSPIRALCEKLNPPCPCDIRAVGDAGTFFEAVNYVSRSDGSGSDGSRDDGSGRDGSHGDDDGDTRLGEQWLWLLHEDSAPEAHCLDYLLQCATDGDDSDSLGIIGAKQVAWENPNKLLEVGIRATRSARRVPDVGHSEYDQGQHDHRREVLAVGSAGMLLRRSALDEIGGFGQGLGPFGDGLELSRRMRAGGYEVIVCPEAKVRHAQHSLGEKARDSFAERRKAQIFNALVSAPTLLFPFIFLIYLLGAFPRALARLFTGEAKLAGAELRAPFALLGSLGTLRQARKRLKSASRSGHRRALRAHEDYPHAIRSAQRAHRSADRDAADMEYVPDPLTEKALRERRQSARSYGWLILAITGLATLIAHLPHFSLQAAGGALLPDSSSFSQGLRSAASTWLASADGYAVPSDIFWAFLDPLSLVTSRLGVSATWVIFLGIIAAAFTAYIAAGDITVSPPMRAVGAIIWAFAPPLLDSVSAGQVAGVLAHIAAPLAVMAYLRAWKGSASALAASALLFAFLASASPMVLPLAIIATIAGFIRHANQRLRWLVLPIPALVMLAPTLFALIRLTVSPPNASTSPLSAPWRLLFSTPGAPLDTQANPVSLLSFSPLGASTFAQLAAFDVGALVRVVPLGVLLVIAIVALVRPSRYRAIRLGWVFIAFGWAWALVASSVPVGIVASPGEYTITHGWTGIALSCAFLGVWIVVLNMSGDSTGDDNAGNANAGSDSTTTKARSFARTLKRIGLSGVGFVCALAGLVYGGLWVADSFTGSASLLKPVTAQAPALALADEDSSYHSRVLALAANENGMQAQLWRGDGIELHETSMLSSLIRADMVAGTHEEAQTDGRTEPQAGSSTEAQADAQGESQAPLPYGAQANNDLADALASLTSNSASVPQALADHGVSVVLVPEDTNDSASRTLVGRLNAVRDLEYITTNETGSFWRVHTGEDLSASVSRLRLDIGDGTSIAVPSDVFEARVSLDSLLATLEQSPADTEKQGKETVTIPKEGRLVLAERADPYWHAELVSAAGTQELKASGESWRQEWTIPLDVEGADIVVYYGLPIQRVWAYVQVAVMALGLLGVLVLPKRKRVRYE